MVAKFIQPDYTAQNQNGTQYPLSLDAAIAVHHRLAGLFAPHAQDTPNMTVRVDAGALLNWGELTEVAAQSTGTITAPVGNPRIDRVVMDAATGVVSVIAGTPAGSPTAPAILEGRLPVCQVLLQTTSTAITNSMITDERCVGNTLSMFASHAQPTPNMTVVVAPGRFFVGPNSITGSDSAVWDLAQQTTPTIVAPVSEERMDRVVLNWRTGAIQVVTGMEGTGVFLYLPTLPENTIPLCYFTLNPSTTSITNAMIVDQRARFSPTFQLGTGFTNYTVTGNTPITSVGTEILLFNFGSVYAGDLIRLDGTYSSTKGGSAGQSYSYVNKKSGTALVEGAVLNQGIYHPAGQALLMRCGHTFKVSVSGTLVLRLVAVSDVSDSIYSISTNDFGVSIQGLR